MEMYGDCDGDGVDDGDDGDDDDDEGDDGDDGDDDDDDDHLCFRLDINLFHLLLLVQLTEQALCPVHQLILFGLGIRKLLILLSTHTNF